MDNRMNEFMTVENLKTMMDIFKGFLIERLSIDPQEIPGDLKKIVYNSMMKTSEVHRDQGLSVKELNYQTLRLARQTVVQQIQGQSQNQTKRSTQSQPLKRETAVFGSRPLPMMQDDLLPEMSVRREFVDVNASMEALKQERNPLAAAPSALQPIETIDAIPSDMFASQLEQLQKARQETDSAVMSPAPQVQTHTMLPAPSVDSQTTSQPEPVGMLPGMPSATMDAPAPGADINMNISSMSRESHRDMMLADILKEQRLAEPQDLYKLHSKEQQEDRDREKQRGKLDLAVKERSSLGFMMDPPPTKMLMQKKYMLIHSLDRDWVHQMNRYQYKVKFNQTTQSVRREPFYANNPVVPYTKTASSPGVPNSSGWYSEANVFYPAYNPSAPPGAIVGYEDISIPIDNDANIQTNFKNIVSLQVTNVILPMDIIVNTTTTSFNKSQFNYNFNLNFPYILLQINEFNDIYEGTDDTIRRSFCQLVYKKSYQSSNGRGYIVMKPVQCEKKVFYPTALSSLPSLSFSFLKPNGELVNKSKDGQTILKLEYEPFNPQFIKVVMNKYFDKNEFFKGDTIQIRNYLLYKITTAQNAGHIQRFNDFVNRLEGHEVSNIGDANDSGFFRTFYIRAPGEFNELTGHYDLDTNMIDQVTEFNESFDFTSNPENGFVLNMSLQNSISITIEQKIYDSVVQSLTV